jgi:hypothetical protein
MPRRLPRTARAAKLTMPVSADKVASGKSLNARSRGLTRRQQLYTHITDQHLKEIHKKSFVEA